MKSARLGVMGTGPCCDLLQVIPTLLAGDHAKGTAAPRCQGGAGDGHRVLGEPLAGTKLSSVELLQFCPRDVQPALALPAHPSLGTAHPWGQPIPVTSWAGAMVVDVPPPPPPQSGLGERGPSVQGDCAFLCPWCQAEAQGSKWANKLGKQRGGSG